MFEIDEGLLARAVERTAAQFDATDFVCAEVRNRLLERLALITLEPEVVVDLGAGTGGALPTLRATYPHAKIISVDRSQAALACSAAEHPVLADARGLPLEDASADIVVSNLMLPGCNEPEQVFAEARRILRHPGLFLFTTFGPDTLKELRRAWQRVDAAPHVHAFADMHNVGDALVHAGFREPVMDVEYLTINYSDPARLIDDLRAAAATNRLLNRRRGLTPPSLWQRFLAELETGRNAAGKWPMTLEVVTGQAWTGPPPAGVQMHEGEARFPLSRLKP